MPALRAAIIAIGDEIVCGDIRDTNGSYLAAALNERGAEVVRLSQVRDDLQSIVEEIRLCSKFSTLLIITGGLGPTTDDITRDAIAKFVGQPLELSVPSLDKIKALFARRKRKFVSINERQAYFPRGALILDNTAGTADAFIFRHDNCHIISLPGVPLEMERLFVEAVDSYLAKELHLSVQHFAQTIKCFGLSESAIGAAVESCALQSAIRVSYRPVFPEVWVKLLVRGTDRKNGTAALDTARSKAVQAIGKEFIVSFAEDESLPQAVAALLLEQGLSFSAAESCSGGLIAEKIVSLAGASRYFKGSAVTYSNEAKQRIVGVRPETLERHGAVSEAVAREMAEGARAQFGSDIAVSITGIAGPDGGSEEKPVGTVWIAVAGPQATDGGTRAVKHFYPTERNRFREYTAALALDAVRRQLLGYTLEFAVK